MYGTPGKMHHTWKNAPPPPLGQMRLTWKTAVHLENV